MLLVINAVCIDCMYFVGWVMAIGVAKRGDARVLQATSSLVETATNAKVGGYWWQGSDLHAKTGEITKGKGRMS